MGLLQLSEFRSELLVALKQRTDLTAAQLNRWINQAYFHLSTPEVRQHQELKVNYDITLASGTNTYALDATTVGFHILGIRDVTYYQSTSISNTALRHDVKPRDLNWFNDHQVPSAGGGPRHYLWDTNEITFSPIPTSLEVGHKVRLAVWREVAPLVNDTDVTVLTNYWDNVLILGAQAIAEYRLGYRELAIATQQLYVSYINEKRAGNELQSEDTGFGAHLETETYL